jgi:hypothetical protein
MTSICAKLTEDDELQYFFNGLTKEQYSIIKVALRELNLKWSINDPGYTQLKQLIMLVRE